MKLGDAIEKNRVVHAIGKLTGCVDPETDQLRPESRCAKRKAWLNNFSDQMYDVFWPETSNPEITTMGKPYLIIKQTAIDDANSPEEAIALFAAGKGRVLNLTATERVERKVVATALPGPDKPQIAPSGTRLPAPPPVVHK